MSEINILDESLINKIAAGEVIERPASVVKELVENSLDAQSSMILIEVRDSGKKLIRITDNGLGMDEEDAKLSILRHATSKIKDVNDLFSISTLGFRGEALASIAAVSQLSIITKKENKIGGFNLVVEGGNIISSGITAADKGTSIEIQNLFFNTPARKKFLKTDAVELRHIIDVVTNYALLHKGVSFKLLHEGHTLLDSPLVDNQRDNIASVYGVSVAKELLPITINYEDLTVDGFIGKPHQARNDKTQQILFVNNRWVKNNDLTKAIYASFHSLLFVGKHPLFILNINLDPESIDVNIHPQKSEIKIEQKERVCSILTQAVQETLAENNVVPSVDLDLETQTSLSPPSLQESKPKPEEKYSFEASNQEILQVHEPQLDLGSSQPTESELIKPTISQQESQEPTISKKLPPLKLLGQVHKTFFLAETPGGFFIIDQHATHERVMYEKFSKQLENKGVEVQTLLQGELIELTPQEVVLLNDHSKELESFGFTMEHFGENTFKLKTTPLLFNRQQPKELFKELLNQLPEGNNSLEELKTTLISRMACRSAVMAGDELTIPAMNKILSDLSHCRYPFSCAHGRPTMIKTNYHELEKKFKRC